MSDLTPPPGPPPAPPAPPPRQQTNGLAVAALVLGILSLLSFFTVVPPFIMGALAVIFGFVGMSKAKQGAPNKGLAIAGLICGVAGIAATIAFIALVVTAGDVVTNFTYTISPVGLF